MSEIKGNIQGGTPEKKIRMKLHLENQVWLVETRWKEKLSDNLEMFITKSYNGGGIITGNVFEKQILVSSYWRLEYKKE